MKVHIFYTLTDLNYANKFPLVSNSFRVVANYYYTHATCLGISIIFSLRVLITRFSVIAHESISGAEEIISFSFVGNIFRLLR